MRAHFSFSSDPWISLECQLNNGSVRKYLGWAEVNLCAHCVYISNPYSRIRVFRHGSYTYTVRLPVRVAGRHWTYLGFELVRDVGGLVSFLYKWVSPGHRCRAHDLHWFFRSPVIFVLIGIPTASSLEVKSFIGSKIRNRYIDSRCGIPGWSQRNRLPGYFCPVKLFSLVSFLFFFFFPSQFSQDGKFRSNIRFNKCGFVFRSIHLRRTRRWNI